MAHPIFSACENGDIREVEQMILQDRSCVHAQDNFQFTPLHAVASTDLVDIAQLLLTNGARIDAKNDVGITALHIANYPSMTELLIASGAQIDILDNEGNSPLISLAGEPDGLDSMELLLKAGARVNLRNKAGETALSVSSDRQETDKVELLRNFGAQ